MPLQSDLREFIELLVAHDVVFVLVGGHAVAFHGHPRYTGDIDFLLRATHDNAARFQQVLEEFGFGDVVDIGVFLEDGSMLQLGRPPNRIDILTAIDGVSFEDVWTGQVVGEVDGLKIPIIGLTELILNKRASGRPKDLADASILESRRA